MIGLSRARCAQRTRGEASVASGLFLLGYKISIGLRIGQGPTRHALLQHPEANQKRMDHSALVRVGPAGAGGAAAAATVLLDPMVVADIPDALQLGDSPDPDGQPRFVVTIAASPMAASTAGTTAAGTASLPRCFEATVRPRTFDASCGIDSGDWPWIVCVCGRGSPVQKYCSMLHRWLSTLHLHSPLALR